MTGVFRKEIRSCRVTMTGYVFISFILAVIGMYFSFNNLNNASPRFETVLQSVQFVFVVFIPILTMRVLSEERKEKTDQLLLTLPLKTGEIVTGKYLALAVLYAVPMLIVCFYPLILAHYGQVNLAAAYLSIIGFFLLGNAGLAIGMFCSSLTDSPVIAAVMSFGTLLVLSLMDTVGKMVPNTAMGSFAGFLCVFLILAFIVHHFTRSIAVSAVFFLLTAGFVSALFFLRRTLLEGGFQRFLSVFYLNGRLTGFLDGILDIPAMIYYLSVIVICLVLTGLAIEKRRWNEDGPLDDQKEEDKRRRLENGMYSLTAAALTVTAAVFLNLTALRLPAGIMQHDFSTARLYSLSETTVSFLDSMDREAVLYHICEGGEEDDTIVRLLERYDESPFVKTEKIDPVLYPGFTSQYTDRHLADNSIIAVSGEKSYVVRSEDFYTVGTSAVTGRYIETGFDGEGLITSAIAYVTSGNMPILYALSANGEGELAGSFAEAVSRSNIEVRELNLIAEEKVPEDASCLLINAPSRDYSKEEADAVISYLEQGGKAIILTNYTFEEMPNLDRILTDYGVTKEEGIILEGNSSRYMSYQYCLIPETEYTDITSDVYNGTYLLLSMAQGIRVLESYRDSISMQVLLRTSGQSYSKADVQNMTTSEKEEGDLDGPFAVGIEIGEDIDNDGSIDTEIVWYSTGYLLDEDYNSSVSGANAELFGDTVSALLRHDEADAFVPIKNMQPQYLSLTDFSANFWTVICVFLVPLSFPAYGISVWYRRRHCE